MEKITVDEKTRQGIDAYADYIYHGGEQLGEFNEENHKKLIEMRKKAENRFYVNWRNSKGRDCKAIGPATKCFCDHWYKEHNFLEPVDRNI